MKLRKNITNKKLVVLHSNRVLHFYRSRNVSKSDQMSEERNDKKCVFISHAGKERSTQVHRITVLHTVAEFGITYHHTNHTISAIFEMTNDNTVLCCAQI